MSEQTKHQAEVIFNWLTRLSIVVLTFLGSQIFTSFNELRADVKLLLKENEYTKARVEFIQREIDKK